MDPDRRFQDKMLAKHEKIKKRALAALYSDDDLMEMLVLKGGNALNLIYNIAARASIDLDFSIQSKIDSLELDIVGGKIEKALTVNFLEDKLQVIDFKFYEKPKEPGESLPEFWGGYRVEFKVIDSAIFAKNKNNPEYMHRAAETVGPGQLKTFIIDISKYEFCGAKVRKKFMFLNIYVYSPEMIAIEKLRAICQQMPEYLSGIRGKETGITERARDFYDIFIILEKLKIDLLSDRNLDLLEKIFASKKAPVNLLGKIGSFREFHSKGYDSLKHTVPHEEDLMPFDFYFDYVLELAKQIISRMGDKVSR